MSAIYNLIKEILKGEYLMRVDRMISIIMTLLDKKRISAQQLADMYEVSLRTIYRDIDAIDLAGIPIRSTPGVGGGFEIMPKYKVDKNVFSTTDLSTILMGLSGVSSMMQGDEMKHALAKVKSFIPEDSAKDIELKVNQIHIDLNSWMGNKSIQQYLEIIKVALEEKKLLSFEYANQHGIMTIRTIEPYQLVLKSNHWYCHGYCLKRKDFRLFRLSRISNLKMKKKVFIPREYQKPQLDFTGTLETMQTKIKIRIHKSIMDRVLDYCPYEDFTLDGEHYIVNFPFIENDYYFDILLGFGTKCECLEPLHIRNEMKQRINNMVTIYQS